MRSDLIVYVEDDQNYAEILETTLKEGCFKHRMLHLESAEEAIRYLEGTGKYANRLEFPIPALLLVDLKMPRMNGLEFLEWVRTRSKYRHLPVVILTSSDEMKDIRRAYTLGANSFLIKPPRIHDLKEMMIALDQFWLKFNVPEK
jgi:CheY-like chemotaxis protein